ncbi:O-antigen biosynthesis protein WbqV [Candidatus Magnetomoraceae bacterium gMMP-15]
MKNLFSSKNFYLVFLIDILLIIISFYLSYAIRFEFHIPIHELDSIARILPFIIIFKMSIFVFFHMYRGMWRYTSLFDLLNIIRAVFISSVGIILALLLIHRFEGYPRSVFIIDWGLTLILVAGVRVVIRLYFARNSGMELFTIFSRVRPKDKKLMIIGAGSTGEKVLREIHDNPSLKLSPIGFLDDNKEKQGKTIHGVKVVGTVDEIESFRFLFDEILIAVPSASGQEMRNIVTACEQSGKRFLTVPAISELIDGKISVKTVRNVTLQDLLGRKEVNLNKEEISNYIHEKRILISGAGGSIGSELVRQVSRFHPKALALVEMSELNLFRVEMECKQRFGYVASSSFLVDIRDKKAITRIFKKFRPDVVFHAAAYKHVPIQEINPWEAVKNNVLGTRNLVQAAQEHKIERFVLVSTDKAVRPANVMGATKRVAESLTSCLNNSSDTRFMAVRFGNVIGSSGSAIPIFQDQIARGGPVTVTHPEITRYFMSIPEAAQLILEAGAMGEGGEIFILDMGEPVRVVDMARDLIRLHGYEPERDIAIQYIGLRPGEKLYEELITEGEGIVKTEHEKIMVLRGNVCNFNLLQEQIDQLINISYTYDAKKIKEKLKEIVPEYMPESES